MKRSVCSLTCPGRSLVEQGRFERNPGPTISASLHSRTVPRPSSLTLNFFSPKSAGLDLIAATTPVRQNPSTHLTVTLAPIIDLFGILFVLLAILANLSKTFQSQVGRLHVSGSAKSLLLPRSLIATDDVSLLLVGTVLAPPCRRRLWRVFTPYPGFHPHPPCLG